LEKNPTLRNHSYSSSTPLILFDGVCNFCNSTVNFIIRRDKKKVFQFAHLQSEAAKSCLDNFKIIDKNIDSIVFIENDRAFVKSTAILRILKHLNQPYSWLYLFILIPPIIRNVVYNIIAKNRYRWFGRNESCILPTEEVKDRFLGL